MNATCGSKIRGDSRLEYKKTADDLEIACSLILSIRSTSGDEVQHLSTFLGASTRQVRSITGDGGFPRRLRPGPDLL